jgi:hypothetical protein
MSSTLQQFPGSPTIIDRRFYPRIVPQKTIYVSFAEASEILVLNLSENGLLLSTTAALPWNLVAHLTLPLNGPRHPVKVTARVVWASESRKLAGIQLLNLSEEDREQIRSWSGCECATPFPGERQIRSIPKSSAEMPEAAQTPPVNETANLQNLPVPTPRSSSPALPQATLGTARSIKWKWPLFVTAVCLAGVFLLRSGALESPFVPSAEHPGETTISPVENALQDLPSPPAPDASPSPTVATKAPETIPPHEPIAEIPTREPSSASEEHHSIVTAPTSHENRVVKSRANSTLSAAPSTQGSLVAASNQVEAQNDPSSNLKNDVNPTNNNSRVESSAVLEPAPETVLPSPPPRLPEAEAPPIPRPSNNSSVSVAPLKSAGAPPPSLASPVIQMDVPNQQVIEVHLPRGNRNFVLNLPGERILETPTATMHIQRSVRLPVTHSGMPVHGDKKIAVGALLSRVDPQVARASVASGDYVRVQATVGEDGHVEAVRFASGQRSLIPAVSNALREWRYQQTFVDGKAVETQCEVWLQIHAPTRQPAKSAPSTTW